jgi:hypothetical protein
MTPRAAPVEADEAARARAHPLTLFGFDALVAGAARPRPRGRSFWDDQGGALDDVAYADLYERVGAALATLRDQGLAPGARIIVCAPPGPQGFVVATAALAAGLEPILAPLPYPQAAPMIARAIQETRAGALVGPAQFCGDDFTERLRGFYAEAPALRRLCILSGTLPGAVDLSGRAPPARRERLRDDRNPDTGARVGALDAGGRLDFATPGALLGAALDLVRATRAAHEAPLLSLCPPASLAALVAGPLTALLLGAPLYSFAPFSAARFRDMLAALGPTRLVAPASALPGLERAGLLADGSLAAVVVLAAETWPVAPVAAACPVVALRAMNGEIHSLSAAVAPARPAQNETAG